MGSTMTKYTTDSCCPKYSPPEHGVRNPAPLLFLYCLFPPLEGCFWQDPVLPPRTCQATHLCRRRGESLGATTTDPERPIAGNMHTVVYVVDTECFPCHSRRGLMSYGAS
jgi:hypothetical protein